MEERNLTCIGCPLGCALKVTIDGDNVTVTGNTCKRGADYGANEVTHPTRIVTSTVCVKNGTIPMVSVKTAQDIPKEKIMDVMDCINRITVEAPVHIGDVLLSDAAATGVTIPESEMIMKPANGAKAKMTKLVVMCNPDRLDALQATLSSMGVNGVTVTHVMGYGSQKGNESYYRGVRTEGTKLLKKVKVEAVVAKIPPQKIIDAVKKVLYTGKIGDGKIFVYDVEDVVKIRTGETGYDALQDV